MSWWKNSTRNLEFFFSFALISWLKDVYLNHSRAGPQCSSCPRVMGPWSWKGGSVKSEVRHSFFNYTHWCFCWKSRVAEGNCPSSRRRSASLAPDFPLRTETGLKPGREMNIWSAWIENTGRGGEERMEIDTGSVDWVMCCVCVKCMGSTGGKKWFDPLLILYVCPLIKKLSIYNFNGRFILKVWDRITTKIPKKTHLKKLQIDLRFKEWNKYLIPYQSARFLALRCILYR